MAIIRSKIARQLLAEGGAPRKPFANGGFDYESAAAFGSDVDDYGMDFVDSDESAGGGNVNFTPKGPSIIDRIGDSIENRRQQSIRNFTNRNMMSTRDAILSLNPFGPKTDMNLFDVYQSMMDKNNPVFSEGLTGTNLNMDRARSTFETLSKSKEDGGLGLDLTKDIGSQLDKLSTTDFRSAFNLDRPTSGGDSLPVLPRLPRIAQVPSDVEQQKSDLGEYIASIRGANPNAFNIPERFRLAEGGAPRQEYGLGSIVKKITGTVKKVVKSDLGKAALAGAAIYGLGGGKLFGGSGFEFGKLPFIGGMDFSKIPGGGVTAGIVGASLLGGLLASKEPEQDINALSQRISDQTGIDVSKIRGEVQQAYQNKDTSSLAQKYPFLVDQEYSASFATGGRIGFENGGTYKDFEEFMMRRQETMSERQKEELRKQFENYMRSKDPTVEAAEGGSIAPEEDEMLNMDGNEMDLRGGGFVPIGEYEKKDDVPARLSKNEFVFTADAVRAAGGGSVDRGADLMYKTMKQLENKVV
jgi:hypothetical protein